jgi:ferredoxin-type protein NapG
LNDHPITAFLRSLFRSDNSGSFEKNRLRPPGAVDEKRFMALCIRCNRCLEVCPYGSIRRAGVSKSIGTPYIYAEQKACYLCMACNSLCPTGALNNKLLNPEAVGMGKAVIDSNTCYSHLFLDLDKMPEKAGNKIGALCNTCYNVCPLKDKAIILQKNLFPVITEHCVGCGICVERCPTRPTRAINVTPQGMGRVEEVGFYFRKARKHFETTQNTGQDGKVMQMQELLERKSTLGGSGEQPKFEFPYEVPKKIEGWD